MGTRRERIRRKASRNQPTMPSPQGRIARVTASDSYNSTLKTLRPR